MFPNSKSKVHLVKKGPIQEERRALGEIQNIGEVPRQIDWDLKQPDVMSQSELFYLIKGLHVKMDRIEKIVTRMQAEMGSQPPPKQVSQPKEIEAPMLAEPLVQNPQEQIGMADEPMASKAKQVPSLQKQIFSR